MLTDTLSYLGREPGSPTITLSVARHIIDIEKENSSYQIRIGLPYPPPFMWSLSRLGANVNPQENGKGILEVKYFKCMR